MEVRKSWVGGWGAAYLQRTEYCESVAALHGKPTCSGSLSQGPYPPLLPYLAISGLLLVYSLPAKGRNILYTISMKYPGVNQKWPEVVCMRMYM